MSFGWQAILAFGRLLPLLLTPLLANFLPESRALHAELARACRPNPAELFRGGLASRTVVLWIVNFCNLICSFLNLVWLPALLYGQRLSPADAIFASTMYAFGSIFGVAVIAPIAAHFGAESVVASVLSVGACSMLAIGSLGLSYGGLCVAIGGVGLGIGGGQHGINSVSGALYPAKIRATGAGWPWGSAELANWWAPLGGGLLLGFGWKPADLSLAASGPSRLCCGRHGNTRVSSRPSLWPAYGISI
jgi:MFS transporter, AAHS family, 4-hydroxybenzoate transporter